MFTQIRNNDQIKGLEINDNIIKLSAYADDTFFIALDVPSLQQVFIICNTFEEFSSLKLNLDKCQACWIGSAKSKLDTPINFNWVNIEKDKILTLGIFNSYDQSLADKYNFLNLITSMRDTLNIWKYRGLTLAGKIQIFKCLAVSKTLYACTMLSPSKQFIDQINSLKKEFVWRGKRPKIKHSTLIGDYKEGGYKDVDTEVKIVALKIVWINKLMANDFHAWKAIPNFVFDKLVSGLFFIIILNPRKISHKKLVYFHNFIKNLFHSGSLLVESNLRASLKLLDSVFGIHNKTR